VVNPDQRTVTAFRREGNVFLPGESFAFDQDLAIYSLGVRVNLQTVATELARQDAIDQKAMAGQRLGTWTYADYAAMPDDGKRYQVIEGVLVEMPSPTSLHQILAGEFLLALNIALNGSVFKVLHRVDIALGSTHLDSSRVVLQPDLVALQLPISSQSLCYLGAPLWVLEVVSPTTYHQDHVVKLHLYEKYGIGEYWLVNPDLRTVTAFRRAGDVFLPGERYPINEQLIIGSLGVRVNLQEVAARLEDGDQNKARWVRP
jgi:Uma2 family endonuclease